MRTVYDPQTRRWYAQLERSDVGLLEEFADSRLVLFAILAACAWYYFKHTR